MILSKHENQTFTNQTVYISGQGFINCQFVDCTLVRECNSAQAHRPAAGVPSETSPLDDRGRCSVPDGPWRNSIISSPSSTATPLTLTSSSAPTSNTG